MSTSHVTFGFERPFGEGATTMRVHLDELRAALVAHVRLWRLVAAER